MEMESTNPEVYTHSLNPSRHKPNFDETLCPICRFKSEKPLQIHYGGQACFSCRAFFRRAHQKTKTPKFYCKQNNACEITVKNRRRCQKCRYDLCLKIGMTPRAVLTEDQKKIRFKNAIKKKEVRSSQNISPEFIGFTDDEEEENPVSQEPVEEIIDSPDESLDLVKKNHYWNQLQTEQNDLPSEGLQNVRNYSVAMFDHQILQNRLLAEEDDWFNFQLAKFDKAWSSVSLGEDHIREFIMFSFDVPVSKSYMHNAIAVYNERVLRLLKIHKEFQMLPHHLQTALIKRNRMYISALQCAVCENSETGYEQLVFTYGQSDKEIMSEEFAHVSAKQIKKMTMANVNKCTNYLADPLMERFNRLVQDIGEFIKTDSMFKLVTLVLLFSDITSLESPMLKEVCNRYLNVMIRQRQEEISTGYELYEENGDNTSTQFSLCISNIKKLADVLQQLNSAPSKS